MKQFFVTIFSLGILILSTACGGPAAPDPRTATNIPSPAAASSVAGATSTPASGSGNSSPTSTPVPAGNGTPSELAPQTSATLEATATPGGGVYFPAESYIDNTVQVLLLDDSGPIVIPDNDRNAFRVSVDLVFTVAKNAMIGDPGRDAEGTARDTIERVRVESAEGCSVCNNNQLIHNSRSPERFLLGAVIFGDYLGLGKGGYGEGVNVFAESLELGADAFYTEVRGGVITASLQEIQGYTQPVIVGYEQLTADAVTGGTPLNQKDFFFKLEDLGLEARELGQYVEALQRQRATPTPIPLPTATPVPAPQPTPSGEEARAVIQVRGFLGLNTLSNNADRVNRTHLLAELQPNQPGLIQETPGSKVTGVTLGNDTVLIAFETNGKQYDIELKGGAIAIFMQDRTIVAVNEAAQQPNVIPAPLLQGRTPVNLSENPGGWNITDNRTSSLQPSGEVDEVAANRGPHREKVLVGV